MYRNVFSVPKVINSLEIFNGMTTEMASTTMSLSTVQMITFLYLWATQSATRIFILVSSLRGCMALVGLELLIVGIPQDLTLCSVADFLCLRLMGTGLVFIGE